MVILHRKKFFCLQDFTFQGSWGLIIYEKLCIIDNLLYGHQSDGTGTARAI